MRGYGLPRDNEVEYPDVGDIKLYGLKTSAGGKDYFKNKAAKAAIRRIWKKAARRAGKAVISTGAR